MLTFSCNLPCLITSKISQDIPILIHRVLISSVGLSYRSPLLYLSVAPLLNFLLPSLTQMSDAYSYCKNIFLLLVKASKFLFPSLLSGLQQNNFIIVFLICFWCKTTIFLSYNPHSIKKIFWQLLVMP